MAASLLPIRPKNGEYGGQCVLYAGMKCFGIKFGANTAKDIWTNTKTNIGGPLPYKKFNSMPDPPCCIVWGNGAAGHVGVIESVTGSGEDKRYCFSDSNRAFNEIVKVNTNLTENQIKAIASKAAFLGYVQFD